MGDKVENVKGAARAMDACRGIDLVRLSPLYRTEPVDFTDQAWFVNGVVLVRTTREPRELLAELARIENSAGRTRAGERFGPRTLDLDIILYDDLVLETPELTVPHPRMHKRCFVLKPLCDIDPTVNHPVLGVSVGELLGRIETTGQDVLPL